MDSTAISSGRKKAAGRQLRLLVASASVVVLFIVWKALALAIGKEIILPSPERVLAEALALFPTHRFLSALWATFVRGLAAFGLSVLIGTSLGLVSGLRPSFESALAPLMTVIRATPVLALVLIALLWFPSGFVPIFSAVLMALPVMVTSAAEGSRAADVRLLEMSSLFRVRPRDVVFRLRLPSALPHILTGSKNALGLTWKVVVAGEILSQPAKALGTGMQESRVLLESSGVFAWAIAAILLCGLSEWLLGRIAKKVSSYVV